VFVDFLLEMWFLPLVNCKGFPDLIVCNQRVLRDLSVHNEGGGSNFLNFVLSDNMVEYATVQENIVSAVQLGPWY
jgi:hypothetical protein